MTSNRFYLERKLMPVILNNLIIIKNAYKFQKTKSEQTKHRNRKFCCQNKINPTFQL